MSVVVVVVVVVVMQAIGGFHVTSSPSYWWTVNKRSLISSFCLSTSICLFHHCYLCLPRLHENHLWCMQIILSKFFFFLSKRIFGEFIFSQHLNMDFTIFLNVFLSDLSKRSLSFKTKT